MKKTAASACQLCAGNRSLTAHMMCRIFTRGVITKTSDAFDQRATEVIDVRAPVEFENDHIPGALNLPVLMDEQRVEVGRTYSQDAFEARKLGAAMVSRNISDHVSRHFVHKPRHYRPLIYCWRGGQRSYSLALVLSQVGFEVLVLEGGYRTYRKQVVSQLTRLAPMFTFVMISGLTGCGKTQLLNALELRSGAQVLDLEGLAHHRGSLLGHHPHPYPTTTITSQPPHHPFLNTDTTTTSLQSPPHPHSTTTFQAQHHSSPNTDTTTTTTTSLQSPHHPHHHSTITSKPPHSPSPNTTTQSTQPPQKRWESSLHQRLSSFRTDAPVWVESESSRIGRLSIPAPLFHQMREAQRVEVCLPLEQRVKHILEEYRPWTQDLPVLKSTLLPLKKIRGQATVDTWIRLAEEGRWEEFVAQILLQHYDLTYRTSQNRNDRSSVEKMTVTLEDLSEQSQAKFVEAVENIGKSVSS